MKDKILDHLHQRKNIFLTGGAGVGKTTLVKDIINQYMIDSKKVAKLASTGMAATLIGGQTLHSFLDLGIFNTIEELNASSKANISKKVKKILSSVDLIIIDEISMVSASLMELIALRLSQSEFNGSLLVVGDFLQLPPVVKNSFNVDFAFESPSWESLQFTTIVLDKNYRTADNVFIDILNSVRFARIDDNCHEFLNSLVKPFQEDLKNFTILFGKNSSVHVHNRRQLSYIDSDLHIKECGIVKHLDSITQKEIDKFIDDSRIIKQLELKIGVPVLFTRNSWNYFNGERGVIVNIDERYLYVLKSDSSVIKLEQVAQSKSVWVEKEIDGKKEMIESEVFTVYQYPVQLAFAITIHKSQGMSITDLIVETNEIFAPSQFYVALSRATSVSRLILIKPKRDWRSLIFVDRKAVEFTLSNQESSIS